MFENTKQLEEKLFSIHAKNEWPEFKSITKESETAFTLELYIQDSLSWFEGHFPEQAVLPGVVQTHWAGCLSELFFSVEGFNKVSNLKFKSMILPDVLVSLSLVFNHEKQSIAFDFHGTDTSYTQGKLFFSC